MLVISVILLACAKFASYGKTEMVALAGFIAVAALLESFFSILLGI